MLYLCPAAKGHGTWWTHSSVSSINVCALLTASYTYHSVSCPLYLCCQVSENIRAISIKNKTKQKNLCCSSDPTVQDLQRETPKGLVTLPEVLTFFGFQRTIFFILSPLTLYQVFDSNVVSNHLIIFSQTYNEPKSFLFPSCSSHIAHQEQIFL